MTNLDSNAHNVIIDFPLCFMEFVFSRKRLFSKSYSDSSSALICCHGNRAAAGGISLHDAHGSWLMSLCSGVPHSLKYADMISSQFVLLLHVIYI